LGNKVIGGMGIFANLNRIFELKETELDQKYNGHTAILRNPVLVLNYLWPHQLLSLVAYILTVMRNIKISLWYFRVAVIWSLSDQ
jgi:hypothetical protein